MAHRTVPVTAETTSTASWLTGVVDRHARSLARPEFLKAARALSVRYVERRSRLSRRPPADSAGKRAAFAGLFAPLHFLTTRAIVSSLEASQPPPRLIVDLGCGTGVAAAAWGVACGQRPRLLGVDRQAWALAEARWNWRGLGLHGQTRRGDLSTIGPLVIASAVRRRGAAVLLAWTLNELNDDARGRLLQALLALPRSVPVLVVEPLARDVTPWWRTWEDEWRRAGGRGDEWHLDVALPRELEQLRDAAGFRGPAGGARSLWLPPGR